MLKKVGVLEFKNSIFFHQTRRTKEDVLLYQTCKLHASDSDLYRKLSLKVVVQSRMQGSSNKDGNQSLAPFFITCSSLWSSTEQPKYSPSKSTITIQESSLDGFHCPKQSNSRIQEHDSSSTLSTCDQSHYGIADASRNSHSVQNIGPEHGSDETCGRHGDQYQKSPFLCGSVDYGYGQAQLNYDKSAASITTFPCSESYFSGLVAAYGQHGYIYPPMMGFTPARVPLPSLECAENLPIFVNAKQFRAILKRRQVRAKIEAHNRLVKSRRPYLHESRHLHALKRPRGAGGRFLNTKSMKQSQDTIMTEKKFIKGSVSWETTMPCGSDVSSIFNGDDFFQQAEARVPMTSGYRVGEGFTTHSGAGNRLFLSIAGHAQK